MFYSNQIYLEAGLSVDQAQFMTAMLGVCNSTGNVLTLVIVRIFTAKQIFLWSTSTISLILAGIGISLMTQQYTATIYLMFALFFNYGLTMISIIFMLVPTFLPPAGVTVAFIWNMITRYLMAQTFLFIQNSPIGAGGGFVIYAGVTFMSFLHALLELPETKGKTLTEVLANFDNASRVKSTSSQHIQPKETMKDKENQSHSEGYIVGHSGDKDNVDEASVPITALEIDSVNPKVGI